MDTFMITRSFKIVIVLLCNTALSSLACYNDLNRFYEYLHKRPYEEYGFQSHETLFNQTAPNQALKGILQDFNVSISDRNGEVTRRMAQGISQREAQLQIIQETLESIKGLEKLYNSDSFFLKELAIAKKIVKKYL